MCFFAVEPCLWAWLGSVWVSLTGITSVCSGICLCACPHSDGILDHSVSFGLPSTCFAAFMPVLRPDAHSPPVSHLNHHCAFSYPCLPALGLSLCIGSCPSPPPDPQHPGYGYPAGRLCPAWPPTCWANTPSAVISQGPVLCCGAQRGCSPQVPSLPPSWAHASPSPC